MVNGPFPTSGDYQWKFDATTAGMWTVGAVQLYGIGRIAPSRLPIQPGVSVIVGRNGSGKSTVLEAIEALFTSADCRWLPSTSAANSQAVALAYKDKAGLDFASDGPVWQRGRFLPMEVNVELPDTSQWISAELHLRSDLTFEGPDGPLAILGPEAVSGRYLKWAGKNVGRATDPEALARFLAMHIQDTEMTQYWDLEDPPDVIGGLIYANWGPADADRLFVEADEEQAEADSWFSEELAEYPDEYDTFRSLLGLDSATEPDMFKSSMMSWLRHRSELPKPRQALSVIQDRLLPLVKARHFSVLRHATGVSTYLATCDGTELPLSAKQHFSSGPHPQTLFEKTRFLPWAGGAHHPAVELRSRGNPLLIWFDVISENTPIPDPDDPPDDYAASIDRYLKLLLLDAPLYVGDGREHRFRSPSGKIVSPEALSSTQYRWWVIAARLAAHWINRSNRVVIVDEPERGLHRSAVRHLLEGLHAISAEPGTRVLTASHALEFVGDSRANRFVLTNSTDMPGMSAIQQLDEQFDERLQAAGIDPVEMLSTFRSIVLVEGPHDELVLTSLFGDQLAQRGVRIVPLHGLKKARHAVESEFIFRFTDAHICFVADGVDSLAAESWVPSLRVATKEGGHERSRALLDELIPKPDKEHGMLKAALRSAIEQNRLERISVFGVDAPDIIEALPESAVLPEGAPSWETIRSDFVASKERGTSKKAITFKQFVEEHYGFGYSEAAILMAVHRMQSVPDTLSRLFDNLLETAS